MVESRHIEYIINMDENNPFQANVPYFYPPEKKKLLAFYCFLGLENSPRFRFLDLDLGLDSWAEI